MTSAGWACEPGWTVGQNLSDLRTTYIPRGVVFKQAAPRVTLVGHKAGILFFVRDQWVCRLNTDSEGTVVSVEKVH